MVNTEGKRYPSANSILLLLIVVSIFVLPALPVTRLHLLYPAFFTGILIFATLSLQSNRKILITCTAVLIIMIWIATIINLESFKIMLRIMQFIYFFYLVGGFVRQISSTSKVTSTVIIESITGYLLLGFAFALMVTVMSNVDANAYNNMAATLDAKGIDDPTGKSIYYTFITYTTTGYGDIIPMHPAAKSLAVLIGVSGQLYVAIIIAMLVGKYAASKNIR